MKCPAVVLVVVVFSGSESFPIPIHPSTPGVPVPPQAPRVLVAGAQGRAGQVAARVARAHGFEVSSITPGTPNSAYKGLFNDTRSWAAVIIDRSQVTSSGEAVLLKRLPSVPMFAVDTAEDAVDAANRVFGCLQ